jgi:hypothetical protein
VAQVLVQQKRSNNTGTLTFDSNVTVGNVIVVFVESYKPGTPTTCADGLSNSYSTAVTGDFSDFDWCRSFTAVVTTGGSCTVTLTNYGSFPGMVAYEISGASTSSPVDAAVTNGGVTSDPLESSITLSQSGGIYIFWGDLTTDRYVGFTSSAGVSFVQKNHDTGWYHADGCDETVATGTYTVGVDLTAGNAHSVMMAVALKNAGAVAAGRSRCFIVS